MKKRTVSILNDIASSGQTGKFTANTLSKKYSVSARTIWYDISEINHWLSGLEEPVPKIEADEEGRFQFPCTPTQKAYVKDCLAQLNNYAYRLFPIERRALIFAKLLNAHGEAVVVKDIANDTGASRGTITNDIREIRRELKDRSDIELVGELGKGLRIRCSEYSSRYLMVRLLGKFWETSSSSQVLSEMILQQIDPVYHLSDIVQMLQEHEHRNALEYSNEGFQATALYLFIAVNRIRGGRLAEAPEAGPHEERYRLLAQSLAESVEQCCGIAFESRERACLIAFLERERPLVEAGGRSELYAIVADFFSRISEKKGMEFAADQAIFDFLIEHIRGLRDASKREKYAAFENGLEDISEEYSDIAAIAAENVDRIEGYLSRPLTRAELNTIVLYVLAALERIKRTQSKPRVLIACPGSLATGQLLAAQIERYFDYRIVGVQTKERAELEQSQLEADFILSTVPISSRDIPSLVVSPILQPLDIIEIHAFSSRIQMKPGKGKRKSEKGTLLDTVFDEAKACLSSLPEEQQEDMLRNIKDIIHEYRAANARSVRLGDLLTTDLICTRTSVSDWRDAVHISGGLLFREGYIEERYIDSIIDSAEKLGPYFVIRKGLALLHAKAEDGAKQTGISLLVLKEGASFGHEYNDPVQLVFCFCADNSKEYFEALNELVVIGKDRTLFERLIEAHDGEEVLAAIEEMEKRVFEE